VLVTGPTGSGKSTTLAALVDKINTEKAQHIITIEDPIEFTHKSKKSVVVQREVHYDTYSFSAALRSSLRQDPDVVLIGEMRDLETISAAITIAETGHLVFSTLHTNSASQTVDRIVDVFPELIKDSFGKENLQVFTNADDLKNFWQNLEKSNAAFLMMSSGNLGGIALT
jgi:twitching motility protein PilT